MRVTQKRKKSFTGKPLSTMGTFRFMTKYGPKPLPVPPAWAHLLSGYVQALEAVGRPVTTIETRRGHIARVSRELGIAPRQVDADALKAWFASQSQWKKETRRSYRNSVVGFFRWAHTEGLIGHNPAAAIPSIGPERPVPRPAPDRVWRAAKMAADPRVMLMLRLAAECGLRRAEVAKVHVNDLREGFTGPQLLVHGKGSRERVVPITDDLAELIASGAAGHTLGAGGAGWLFPGDDGGHLSPRWVGTLCSNVMPGVWTMHTLRHRFATNAYRGSRDIRAVQELLGHSSLAVTQRYTATDDDELRAAMMAAARAS